MLRKHYKKIAKAYEVLKLLSDPQKSQVYDQFGEEGLNRKKWNNKSSFNIDMIKYAQNYNVFFSFEFFSVFKSQDKEATGKK